MSTNKIFIAYREYKNSTYSLYGIVCTINNSSITKGTNTLINSSSSIDFYSLAIETLLENKVLITYKSSIQQGDLCGIVCNINGTTITARN